MGGIKNSFSSEKMIVGREVLLFLSEEKSGKIGNRLSILTEKITSIQEFSMISRCVDDLQEHKMETDCKR